MVVISRNDKEIAPTDTFSAEEVKFFIEDYGIDPINDREPNELGFSYSAVIPLRIGRDIAERVSLRVIFNEDSKRLQLYLWHLESCKKIIDDHQVWCLRDFDEQIELARILLKPPLQVRRGFLHLENLLLWAESANLTTFGEKLAFYLFGLFHGLIRGLNSIDIAEAYQAPFKNGFFYPELVFELPPFYWFLDFYGSFFNIVFDSLAQEFIRSLLHLAPAGWLKKNWDALHDVYRIEIYLFGEASTFSRLPKSNQKKVMHLLKRHHNYIYSPEFDKPGISIIPLVTEDSEGVDTFRYEKVLSQTLVSIILRYNLCEDYSVSWEFIIFDQEKKQGTDIYKYNALFYWPRLGGFFFDTFQLMEVYVGALGTLEPQVLINTNASFMKEIEERGLTGREEPEDDLFFSCLSVENPSAASSFQEALISKLKAFTPPEWMLENHQLLFRIYQSHPLLEVKPEDYRPLKNKEMGEIRQFFERSFFQTMDDRIVGTFHARNNLLQLAWDIYWKMEQSNLGMTFDNHTLEWILAIVAESELDFDESVKNLLRKLVPTPRCDEKDGIHTFPLLLAMFRDAASYPEGIVLEKLSVFSDMMCIQVDPPVKDQDENLQTQERWRRVYLDEEEGLKTRSFRVTTFLKKECATIWKIFCILDPD